MLRAESGALTLSQRDSYARRREGVLVEDVRSLDDGATFEITLDGAACPFYAEGIGYCVCRCSCSVIAIFFTFSGGGQPSDHGTVNGVEILSVANATDRYGVKVQLRQQFEIGTGVTCEVDWARRFDFMQQHTGQHLLSAVADRLLNAETVRWELGREYVLVSITCARDLTSTDLLDLELAVNAEIRACRSVTSVSYAAASFDEIPFRRGMVKGAASNLAEIRVVTIDGLDSNPCGGTHVHNLAELQCVKIMGMENDREATRIKFIAGNRVLQALGISALNEARLSHLLTAPPEAHADAVDKLLVEKRSNAKEKKMLGDELALMTARAILQNCSDLKFFIRHIAGAELSFLQAVSEQLFSFNGELLVFLSGDCSAPVPQVSAIFPMLLPSSLSPTHSKKDAKSRQQKQASNIEINKCAEFVLVGQSGKTALIKEDVMKILGARGGGRPGKLQGTFDALTIDLTSALSSINALFESKFG